MDRSIQKLYGCSTRMYNVHCTSMIPLSPILFNIYPKHIMSDTMINLYSCIPISGKEISNLRFADDIDQISGRNDELKQITNSLSTYARYYGM